jgi:hypothetical protein
MLSPILYKFANDEDGVNDNTGVLEGYGTVTQKTKFQNVIDNITDFFKKIGFYLEMMFNILAKSWNK